MKVSCILASRRPELVGKAIAMFEAQSYPDRELVIVQNADESPAPVPAGVVGIIAAAGTVLGAKLNLGISAAKGALLHKWDDDDLYAPGFLYRGIAQLQHFDLVFWTNCLVQFPDGVRQLRGFEAGGSMLFTRALWGKVPFRNNPAGVDSTLLADAKASKMRVSEVIDAPELYTYVRNGANTWTHMPDGTLADNALRKRSSRWPPLSVRVPFLRRSVGLGDALKGATSAIGVKPCAGCDKRAEALNAKVKLIPR